MKYRADDPFDSDDNLDENFVEDNKDIIPLEEQELVIEEEKMLVDENLVLIEQHQQQQQHEEHKIQLEQEATKELKKAANLPIPTGSAGSTYSNFVASTSNLLNYLKIEQKVSLPLQQPKNLTCSNFSVFTDLSYLERPSFSAQNFSNNNSFIFMQTDIDYYTCAKRDDPLVRIFGVTAQGNSVMVHVHRFLPYFWIKCPPGFNHKNDENTIALKKSLNALERKHQVILISPHKKKSIRQYKGQIDDTFLKIKVAQPQSVKFFRTIFESGFHFENIQFYKETYESNIPFALRFMTDRNIVGMSWLELSKNQYTLRQDYTKVSRCQIELDVDYEYLSVKDIKNDTTGQWSAIAPLRILSFDIETIGGEGFEDLTKHNVIQIAAIIKFHDQSKEQEIRKVLVLDTCDELPNAQVITHNTERELLQNFENLIQIVDPDIITGYNIVNFDMPCLLTRARDVMKMFNFGYWGRIKKTISKIEHTFYYSKVLGKRKTLNIGTAGRIQWDMLRVVLEQEKLSSYSLGKVCERFLNRTKEDVHYSEIETLQKKDSQTRKRLAKYCLQDANLVIDLMRVLLSIYTYTEMARVTRVPIKLLFSRGQQIKVVAQLLHRTKHADLLLPAESNYEKKDIQAYSGAYVMEPSVGLYKQPIATLDFASLYPSIIIAYNLCYTTLISEQEAANMNEDHYLRTPNGFYFVKTSIRKGLLPSICDDLLEARKKAKADAAAVTDNPTLRLVLDAKQNALKLSANSVYGFVGAQAGNLPCVQVASSVTAYGRQMIQKTACIVELTFCKHATKVIYGDTDSVMISFNKKYSNEEVIGYAQQIAAYVTSTFTPPIKLIFEKLYNPFLLIRKKKYTGLKFNDKNKQEGVQTRGLEIIRRDTCELVRHTMSEVVNKIMVTNNVDSAVYYCRSVIDSLFNGEISISQLVITKAVNKKIAYTKHEQELAQNNKQDYYQTKGATQSLALKLFERSKQITKVGDRLPYVIVEVNHAPKTTPLMSEKAEDPTYVIKHNLSIDYQYYVDKQLGPPLTKLFEHIIKDTSIVLQPIRERVFKVPIVVNEKPGITKWLKKKPRCMFCHNVCRDNQVICESCKHDKAAKVTETIEINENRLQQLRTQNDQMTATCETCQGNSGVIICQNADCNIFYQRLEVDRDYKNQQILMSKLNW